MATANRSWFRIDGLKFVLEGPPSVSHDDLSLEDWSTIYYHALEIFKPQLNYLTGWTTVDRLPDNHEAYLSPELKPTYPSSPDITADTRCWLIRPSYSQLVETDENYHDGFVEQTARWYRREHLFLTTSGVWFVWQWKALSLGVDIKDKIVESRFVVLDSIDPKALVPFFTSLQSAEATPPYNLRDGLLDLREIVDKSIKRKEAYLREIEFRREQLTEMIDRIEYS